MIDANYRAAAAARLPPVPPDDSVGRVRGRNHSWMLAHDYHHAVVGDSNGMTYLNVKVTG